jgi:chitodextrinase
VPSSVAATALSLTDIRIDWTASTDQGGAGLAGYRIFRNGSSSVLATVTNGTSYTDAGLSPNTNYSYQVRAFDGANPPNESALSTPAASATTQADTTAPTIPSGVTATAVSGTQIRIDWTASTDAGVGVAGYRIYRDGSTSILATVTSGTTFTDSGLTLNTTYSYQVLAFDNATPSNVSALSTPAASATTQADNTAPTVPSSVAATALSSTQIRVDWTASTDAGLGVAGYRIYRNGNSSVLATVTSGTSFTDGTVLPNTTYTYQVRAYDNALPPNVSALSTPAASATTPADTTAPAAPSGVTATVLSASSIRIDWSASVDTGGAGLAGYRVYRDGSSSVLATVTSGT